MATLKIGELARRTHCQVETIRYYEKAGLLPPPVRTEANYRLYHDAHVDRLLFIRHCRSLDMTLDEVRALLRLRDMPESGCAEVGELLDTHLRHVETRIVGLRELAHQLEGLRTMCSHTQTTSECGILQGIAGMEESTSPVGKGTHGGGCH